MKSFEDIAAIQDLTTYSWYRETEDDMDYVLKTLIGPRELRLTEHPYNLPPDTLHYILWSKKDMTKDQVSRYLKTRLKNRDYVAFTNFKGGLFHVHVLCKIPQ